VKTRAANDGAGAPGVAIPLPEAGEGGLVEALLEKLVAEAVRRYSPAPRQPSITASSGLTERVDARAIIRQAALRSAAAGAATGALATAASVVTAQTQGLAGLAAVPITALSIGGDVVFRLFTHVKMICEVAALFDLSFDPDDPRDLWALFALAFERQEETADEGDPGRRLARWARAESRDVTERVGARLLGESVARNLVPFVSIVSSSVTSYLVTRRLGETVRRYARYRRAFDAALADASLRAELDVLIEGVWFLFEADGRLKPEETALLAALLRAQARARRPRNAARLTERLADDVAWIERLREVPAPARAPLLRALEIAAAVDKFASARERALLRHAAEALDLPFDEADLEAMIRSFEETGVLPDPAPAARKKRRREHKRAA
jgi:hypothetical protein